MFRTIVSLDTYCKLGRFALMWIWRRPTFQSFQLKIPSELYPCSTWFNQSQNKFNNSWYFSLLWIFSFTISNFRPNQFVMSNLTNDKLCSVYMFTIRCNTIRWKIYSNYVLFKFTRIWSKNENVWLSKCSKTNVKNSLPQCVNHINNKSIASHVCICVIHFYILVRNESPKFGNGYLLLFFCLPTV